MWKVDMSDFYMHLLITEEDRLFFRFRFEGISYEGTAMPFGLGPAPRIATKFLLPAMRYLRRRQVRCMAYIDDIWGCARSRTKAVRDAHIAVNLLCFLISVRFQSVNTFLAASLLTGLSSQATML